MSFRSLAKLLKLLKLKVVIDEVSKQATVSVPLLTLTDIGRTGNINVLGLQNLLIMSRMAAYHIPSPDKTFLEYDKLTEDLYTFLASSRTEVSQEFYQLTDSEEWPGLEVSFHLGYMGSSSLNTVASVRCEDSGHQLATNTNTVVCVDKQTRRPAPIPDWWREKYSSSVIGNNKLAIPPFSLPCDAFCYQIKVLRSDVDAYKHTNYLSYVRYCFDAAFEAIVNNKLIDFDGDVYEHHVQRLDLLYISETTVGNVIDVFVWQDQNDHNLIYFYMKHEGKDIFQSKIQFYPKDSS